MPVVTHDAYIIKKIFVLDCMFVCSSTIVSICCADYNSYHGLTLSQDLIKMKQKICIAAVQKLDFRKFRGCPKTTSQTPSVKNFEPFSLDSL